MLIHYIKIKEDTKILYIQIKKNTFYIYALFIKNKIKTKFKQKLTKYSILLRKKVRKHIVGNKHKN